MYHLQHKLPLQVFKRSCLSSLPVMALLAFSAGTVWSAGTTPDRLFADDTHLFVNDAPLHLKLNAPIRKITRDRDQDPEYRPGKLGYTDSAGKEFWFDVGVRPRGKSRRRKEFCRFPPLRLNFKTKQVEDSLFAQQDKLKLVTHCKPSSQYEQFLLVEYLTYKALNLLTDHSFKVRLLTIQYLDGDKDLGTFSGFLIEHKNNLAARINRKVVEPVSIVPRQLEPEHASIVELYQLMIGNTDFSLLKGPTGDVCCHNAVLYENNGNYQPIPYDFDSTGLVNPPYAVPNEALKLRTVKVRRYRGFCRSEELLENTLQLFQGKKKAIYDLFGTRPLSEDHALSKRTSHRTRSYLDGFFAIIEDPEQLDRKVTQVCR